jgi:hypothetical protein
MALTIQQWCGKSAIPNDDGELSQSTKDNLFKFAHNLSGELRVRIISYFAYIKLILIGRNQTRFHARRPHAQGIHPPLAVLA